MLNLIRNLGFAELTCLHDLLSPFILSVVLAKKRCRSETGNTSANVSLPADAGTEAVNQVNDDPPQGIERIQLMPQVVNQGGGHQTPDRSGGSGMNAVTASSRFWYYGCRLFLPFKGDNHAMAHCHVGHDSDDAPSVGSHTVHLPFCFTHSIDFNTILKHG